MSISEHTADRSGEIQPNPVQDVLLMAPRVKNCYRDYTGVDDRQEGCLPDGYCENHRS